MSRYQPASVRLGALGLLVLACVALTGCVEQAVPPAPDPEPTTTASAQAPAPVVFDAGGSAQSNLAFFDLTNEATIAATGAPDGRAFIDGLVSAGFDKAMMELTPDSTAIGLQADSVQFSVRFGDSCIIGQYGNIGYASTVQPSLSTGTCFIGITRPINW